MKVETTGLPQFRKRRISTKGKVVRVTETDGRVPRGEIENQLDLILPLLIEKGWCVTIRNGYLALAGFKKQETILENGKKQHDLIPRDEIIVFIAKVLITDFNKKNSVEQWEVKSHWTGKRNLFADFQSAGKIFMEIENRWDPGTILWTNIERYERLEPY